MYGAEWWVLSKKLKCKLLAFEMRNLWRFVRIRWTDMIRNKEVRRISGVTNTVFDRMEDIQRRWLGHVERMNLEKVPRQNLYMRMHGTEPRGRPRTSWLRSFKSSDADYTWPELVNMARNRELWREYRKSRYHDGSNPTTMGWDISQSSRNEFIIFTQKDMFSE